MTEPERHKAASKRAVCEPAPCPSEVMRKLQAIAVAQPELSETMREANMLISRQSAFVSETYRALIGSRMLEHLG